MKDKAAGHDIVIPLIYCRKLEVVHGAFHNTGEVKTEIQSLLTISA